MSLQIQFAGKFNSRNLCCKTQMWVTPPWYCTIQSYVQACGSFPHRTAQRKATVLHGISQPQNEVIRAWGIQIGIRNPLSKQSDKRLQRFLHIATNWSPQGLRLIPYIGRNIQRPEADYLEDD